MYRSPDFPARLTSRTRALSAIIVSWSLGAHTVRAALIRALRGGFGSLFTPKGPSLASIFGALHTHEPFFLDAVDALIDLEHVVKAL